MSSPALSAVPSFEQPSRPGQLCAVPPARAEAVGLKILIIEDSAEAARLLGTLLRLVGHEIRIALDAEEALEAVGLFRPQALVLDLGLPSMGGLELARRLRREKLEPRPLMIALTAERGVDMQGEVLRAGCDHFMAKPVDFERLCRLLSEGCRPGSAPGGPA